MNVTTPCIADKVLLRPGPDSGGMIPHGRIPCPALGTGAAGRREAYDRYRGSNATDKSSSMTRQIADRGLTAFRFRKSTPKARCLGHVPPSLRGWLSVSPTYVYKSLDIHSLGGRYDSWTE